MKFLLLTLFCLIFAFPAFAYLETKNYGETEATAGEQNTGLYNLNSATEIKMKQLKKFSEAMKRNPELNYSDTDLITNMLSGKSEEEIETEEKLKKLFNDVVRRTANKKALVVSAGKEQLNFQTQIKDSAAVAQLRQRIRRR